MEGESGMKDESPRRGVSSPEALPNTQQIGMIDGMYFFKMDDNDIFISLQGDVKGVLGYEANDLIGTDAKGIVDPSAIDPLVAAHREPSTCPLHREFPCLRKDGSTVWIESKATRQPDGMIFGIASDITERKQAQQSMFAAVKEMPGVLIITDSFSAEKPVKERFIHLDISGDSVGIIGYTKAELMEIGLPTLLWDEASIEIAEKQLLIFFSGKTPPELVEMAFKHKDGTKVWLRPDKLTRRLNASHLFTVFHDVTKDVQLREEVVLRRIAEATASRFKAACSYLSHEIRNQIFPQSIILEGLKEKKPQLGSDLDTILSANATVTGILDSILDLAKWESEEFPICKSSFPLKSFLEAVAAFGEATLHRSETTLEVHGLEEVDASLLVEGDPHILKQACTNLLSNAIKFTPAGKIKLMTNFKRHIDRTGVLTVVVHDTGRGLTAGELDKVLMPFAQIRKAGDAQEGTGLGLPLTKAMIETGHGGILTLESEGKDMGVKATVIVPLGWAEQQVFSPDPSDLLAWVTYDSTCTVDVLIVDDSSFNRRMISSVCEEASLVYEEVEDGAQALQKMASTRYAVVSMDNQMPHLNGAAAMEQAHAAGYCGQVVMVSGDSFQPCEEAELRNNGFTAFLTKGGAPSVRHMLQRLGELKKAVTTDEEMALLPPLQPHV